MLDRVMHWVISHHKALDLDELVIQACLVSVRNEMHRTGVAHPHLEDYAWAEREVYDMNDAGVLDQLTYLWETYSFDGEQAFVEWLAEELRVPMDTLNL